MSKHLKVGTVIQVIQITLLNLIDRGEIDSKIIALPVEPKLRIVKANSLSQFRANYLSIQKLIELWFLSYKGPNTIVSKGWENEKVAKSEIARWVTSE